MRKLLIITLILLMAAALIAEPIKVALGNLDKKDKDSDYIVSAMIKRDFKSIFDANSDYELMDIKKTDKEIAKANTKAFIYLGKDEKLQVAKTIGADVIMWGNVTSQNKNQFKVNLNMLVVESGDFNNVTFQVTKNSDERIASMKENIFCSLEQACVAKTDILIDIAMQQFTMRNYEQAEESFLAVLGVDSQNVQALYYLGAVNFINKKYEQALKYYLQALEIAPDNDDVLNQLSIVYKKLDRFEEAIETLKQISDMEENADIWMQIAGLYQNIEYYADAQDSYEKAISLNDSLNVAYLELGNLLYEQEYYDEALPYLEEAMKRFPDDDMLNKKLAKAYQKTGKINSAIKQYNDLIAANPNNLKAYYNLANAYITINDYDLALKTAQTIKSKDTQNPKVYILLANSYSTLKNYQEAENAALKALELDMENYQAFRILSEIYQDKGYVEYEKFLDFEEKAKTLYGDEADAMIEKRDNAKDSANKSFQKSKEYLDEAEKRTTLDSEMRYIKQRRATLQQLLDVTKKSFF
ncbi:MAG: tetratricopeptide repeat protein [Candidatus Cloacimonetes bacterium]|nr:tetratricopeptide repeat protein [Candidatus Cloacimonadota bacterium]